MALKATRRKTGRTMNHAFWLIVFLSWLFSCYEMIVDVDIRMGGIKHKGRFIPRHCGNIRHNHMEEMVF